MRAIFSAIGPLPDGALDRVSETLRQRGPDAAGRFVGGSARPQLVEKDVNPRYGSLIEVFDERTGIAVFLNNAFNVQEPIVCTPEDAVNTFPATDVDGLVMQNQLVARFEMRG